MFGETSGHKWIFIKGVYFRQTVIYIYDIFYLIHYLLLIYNVIKGE